MKLRFPSDLPQLDRTARLPLLLAALLLAACAFQFWTPGDAELLPATAVGGGRMGNLEVPNPPLATGRAIINARSMFAPSAIQPASGAASNPLGGFTIAGSVQVGRAVFAVVQGPGNRIARIPPGGRIGDWRLRAIRGSEALLDRDEEQITVPFGGKSPLPTTATPTRSQP